MTVKELIELNQMITDIEIIVRVNGTALLDALFIGPAVGEKPRYPCRVPKERKYVGNMSRECQKEAQYIAKSINSWDDGKDYWQVKIDRIPKGWRDLEVYGWEVWPASCVCYTSPRRQTGHWISHREHCEMNNLIPSGLGSYFWCSECGCGIDSKYFRRVNYKYCPECGIKMEGK